MKEVVKNYFWDKRTHRTKPDIVGKVFEGLEKKFGSVTPENFLEASRPEDSPTHKEFEWDDTKAAENYRLQQSQRVINDLRIEVVVKEKPFKVPAYVNISREDRGTSKYQQVTRVFQVAETREIVLARAREELERFRVKYEKFEEFASVIEAIKALP